MKKVIKLKVIMMLLILNSCSGGGEGENTVEDFSDNISASDCYDSFINTFNEPDYFDEQLSSNIRTGNAACVKKVIDVANIDVNKPITGFFTSEPTLPVWRALDKRVFFFSDVAKYSVIKVLVEAGAQLDIVNENGETPLIHTLKHAKDYPTVAEYLINTGKVDLDKYDRTGNAAIHYVIENNNLSTLESLIEKKANLDLQDSNGTSPIIASIEKTWSSGVMALLGSDVDVSAKTNDGDNLLHIAIKRNMNEVSLKLIDVFDPVQLNEQGFSRYTAINLAITEKNYDVAKALLNADVDLSAPSSNSNLPLHNITFWLNDEISFLVASKTPSPSIDAKNNSGSTALHLAAQNNRVKLTEQLLLTRQADATVTDNSMNTPLHFSNDPVISELLIANNANVNQPNSRSHTPFSQTVLNPNESLFNLYKDNGGDFNWTDLNNNNLLHLAVSNNFNSVVKVLLTKIDPNNINTRGNTPLFLSASFSMFTELTSNDSVNLSTVNNDGDNLFTTFISKYIRSRENEETLLIIKRLIDLDVDVNHKASNKNESALFDVVRTRRPNGLYFYDKLMPIILNSNLDINLQNNEGKTALFYVDDLNEAKALMSGSSAGGADPYIQSDAGITILDQTNREIRTLENQVSGQETLLAGIQANLDAISDKESDEYKQLEDIRNGTLNILNDARAKLHFNVELLKIIEA